MQEKNLKTYRSKRDFTQTPEPKKNVPPTPKAIFVVQKHAASHLHYDFRLEIDGVLKSWAVPKGPPLEVGEKRLAVQTEDHPLAYATFKGTIPAGNYGAGTVEIWDHGTFAFIDKKNHTPEEALEQGHLEIILQGKKLKGPYALIRTHFQGSTKPAWLLIKMNPL